MRVVEGWLNLILRYLPLLLVLAAISADCAGCIWLAVPSLAYEGYKYVHQPNPSSSPDGSGGSSNSQSTSGGSGSSDHSIE